MRYLVKYTNTHRAWVETVIDVPDHILWHDSTADQDVPLYIASQLEDLDTLEHYEEAAE